MIWAVLVMHMCCGNGDRWLRGSHSVECDSVLEDWMHMMLDCGNMCWNGDGFVVAIWLVVCMLTIGDVVLLLDDWCMRMCCVDLTVKNGLDEYRQFNCCIEWNGGVCCILLIASQLGDCT
eukprot:815127_1